MAVVLVELHRQDGVASTKFVLRAETYQHQIQRTPTIITIPGKPDTGEPQIVGYDLGVTAETFTLTGQVPTQDENVVSGDLAYEAGVTKVYPGMRSLRKAALYWWADANWGVTPTGLVKLRLPLIDVEGIIASCQFTLEPARDVYDFSLVFRVTKYG